MAELRQYRIEEMLQELQQLERLHLLEKREVRLISKKRKEFESKIQKLKNKEDYLNYIQYEMDLLKLIGLRKEKSGVTVNSDLDHATASQINRLFKQAILLFQEDFSIWSSYVKFCKHVRCFGNVRQIVERVLNTHSDKPALWKSAAKFEMEENKCTEMARDYLLRGIRFNPMSKMLYTEAFRLELLYADSKQKKNKASEPRPAQPAGDVGSQDTVTSSEEGEGSNGLTSATNESESGESIRFNTSDAINLLPGVSVNKQVEGPDQVSKSHLAEVIYEAASKKIDDLTFYIGLLDIAKEYSFTYDLRCKMASELLRRYQMDERAWDVFARRELESRCDHVSPEASSGSVEHMDVSEEDGRYCETCTANLKERMKSCCVVYMAAVKQLPTERMWSLYIERLLEFNQDLTHHAKFRKRLLERAFRGAHSVGLLQEKYYVLWALHVERKDNIAKILSKSTQKFPLSIELWLMRLRFHLSSDEEDAGVNIFNIAINQLGTNNAETLPLWKTLIQYFQTKSVSKVEHVFRQGITQGPAVALLLRPMYLQWVVLVKGIAAARKVYDTISAYTPYCLELHQKMISHECMLPQISLKQVRKCFDLACEQFGQSNTDVWMEYIKFEQKRGDSANVSIIHCRALNALTPEQSETFINEFCLVNTGLDESWEKLVT